jgi:hypothetical protein
MSYPSVRITIAEESFRAQLQHHLAPQSCARLLDLLPYRGELMHARWSGEACWSPLSGAWPAPSILQPENAIGDPAPGEILLFAGDLSEPELLIPYGSCRFACLAGPLAGNPVLRIDDDQLARLAECGRSILRNSVVPLLIERPVP